MDGIIKDVVYLPWMIFTILLGIKEVLSTNYYHYNQLHLINNTDGPCVQTGSWSEVYSPDRIGSRTFQGIFIHTTRRETWNNGLVGSQ